MKPTGVALCKTLLVCILLSWSVVSKQVHQCPWSTFSILLLSQTDYGSKISSILPTLSEKAKLTSTGGEKTPSSNNQQQNEESSSNQFALIITGPARVLKELSPDSPILGMANRGKHYPLIQKGDSWCIILYEDQRGWIERRHVSIVDKVSKNFILKEFLITLLLVVLIVALIILVFFLINNPNKIKSEWFSTEKKRKRIIIVASSETLVPRHLTDTTTTLEKCFLELGFEIRKANDSNTTMKMIYHYYPDAIIVDWQLGNNTLEVMEQVLSSRSDTSSIFVLFYNVNNPESVKQSGRIPNAHYLGSHFNDRELFNLITPLIITREKRQSIRKSIEASALQGDLSTGDLSEIFQFIEIGKKTGSLLIEDEKPVGIVYFNDGIIIYAATKRNTGKKAVLEILNLHQGQFQFVIGRHPKSPNCSIPTLEILMEWTKESDETSRDRLR